MKLIKPLEQLERKYSVEKDNYDCLGATTRLYRVDTGKIAKMFFNGQRNVLRNDRKAIQDLFKEYNNLELARDLGVNYPEPEGIFAIKENSSGLYFPGLVMQDVGDKTLESLCFEESKKALKQRDLEVEKANEAGLFIGDNHLRNAIFHNNQVYLIDAEGIRVM